MPTLAADRLRTLLTDLYRAAGASRDAAATVAEYQVLANLVGHDSHGVLKTADYIEAIDRGHLVPDAPVEIVSDGPTSAVIDAHWGFGFVATRQAMDLVCDKAAHAGMAAATVRRQGHVGRLGAYTTRAAERGLIGLMTADSGQAPKAVAPFGGRERRLGTNPLSIAVPSAQHGAVLLDMATSTVAVGKVKLARSRGESIPTGWLVDADGQQTTDPAALEGGGALLPLGADQGHKGYALSFMVEVLSGLLTGIGFGVDPGGRHNDGVFLAAIDVERFRPLTEFRREVSDFVEYLKATPVAEGYREILYPGEMEQRTADQRSRDGITVEDRTWTALTVLGERFGVPLPAPQEPPASAEGNDTDD